jgi:hypothetical protein
MRRQTPMLVLLVAQGFVLAAGAVFHFAVRPQLLQTYADSAIAVPWGVRLALGSWLLPATLICALLTSLAMAASGGKRGIRLRVIAVAVTASGFVLMAAALSSFMPLLRP